MWAVVGLGNPGRRYSKTRHNTGFLFVKRVAKSWEVKLKKKSSLSKTVQVEHRGQHILLALPQTYMNRSGLAVDRIIKDRGVKPENLLVVYDDLDLPLGDIRIRPHGGAGSHKGLSSIIQEIQTDRFPRLRVGIGPLPEEESATAFVLSPFSKEESPRLEKSLNHAQEALQYILEGNIEKAMNLYN